jgi:hypothetical protein
LLYTWEFCLSRAQRTRPFSRQLNSKTRASEAADWAVPRTTQSGWILLPTPSSHLASQAFCLCTLPFPQETAPLLVPLFQQINPFCMSRRVRKRSSFRDWMHGPDKRSKKNHLWHKGLRRG